MRRSRSRGAMILEAERSEMRCIATRERIPKREQRRFKGRMTSSLN